MNAAAFAFDHFNDKPALYAHKGRARLPGNGDVYVCVDAHVPVDRVSLVMSGPVQFNSMAFTIEQARAVAAELLAAVREAVARREGGAA